jgi:DNA (cytosine-5)-methyltransferase 1
VSTGNLTSISLFTGAGGLDLGFEAAGFETRVAVEMDREAIASLRLNRPQWRIIDSDINGAEATSAKILRGAGLRAGDPDVLTGGPPCQPFSKSGYWARGDARRLDDPRANTLEAFLRVLRDTQPRAFVLENVPGLAFDRKDEGLQYLRRSIEGINHEIGTRYSFEVELLRAVEYGVPQDRQRVFVVGMRDGADFIFPAVTHSWPTRISMGEGEPELAVSLVPERGLEPYTTAWDAIADLDDDDDPSLRVTGKWAELLPSIPEGKNYLYHTDRGAGLPLFGWRRRYWNFLLKLAKRLPSWTIAAQPGPSTGPFHWRNRRLSASELLRLQTFPADYRVCGSLRSAQKQIGNAVPSLLAATLAQSLRAQLGDETARAVNFDALRPPSRGQPPEAEPLFPVPQRYLELVGEHAPHPGTGLGARALARPTRLALRGQPKQRL